jgi:hypothetical protein
MGLAGLAGAIYGAFLGGVFFGRSWITLGLGALLGLAILAPVILQMVLGTAGVFMGMSGIGPAWTEYHEQRARRIAKFLLVLVIVSGAIGLIFAPIR